MLDPIQFSLVIIVGAVLALFADSLIYGKRGE